MSDKKFDSFKIADRQPPKVAGKKTAAAAPSKAQPDEQAQTLGFARIEAILDHEDPKQVHQSLSSLLAALDKLAAKSEAPKERAQAKRAKQAIEHTLELLTYLFQTKNDMLQAYASAAPAGKGKARPTQSKGGR